MGRNVLWNGPNPPRGVCEVEMLPVVPAENPPQSELQILRCSHELRNGDAKATERIGLADKSIFTRVSGGLRVRARRSYNPTCILEGEEERIELSNLSCSRRFCYSDVAASASWTIGNQNESLLRLDLGTSCLQSS